MKYLNLRTEMLRYKLKQNDLAKLLGLSKTTLSFKLHGTSDFKLDEVNTILKEFKKYNKDITYEYLFKES